MALLMSFKRSEGDEAISICFFGFYGKGDCRVVLPTEGRALSSQ